MPQVLMDPPPFMLALLLMTNAEYRLWRNDIPYVKQLLGNFDHDEFSEARLMAPFPIKVCTFLSSISFFFLPCLSTCDDIQIWWWPC